MKSNPFRVSFDAPLLPRDLRRGRMAALLLIIGGTGAIVSGALAVLHAGSATIGEITNASPDQNVRVLGTPVESGRPCEDQTWPYLEPRCLKQADSNSAERSTPKHGLGSQKVVLPAAPVTAASEKSQPAPARETTGSAPVENANAGASAPPQLSDPRRVSGQAQPLLETEAARQRQDAKPARSAREARRQERARLQRERREAKRAAREQRQLTTRGAASKIGRDARRDGRRTREFSYTSPDGRRHRVIVIRPGIPGDDDFF